MQRWLVVAGCALLAGACSDRPQPAAPRPHAGLLGNLGSLGTDDHAFDLSSVVTVNPSLKMTQGSGPPEAFNNPERDVRVGPNVVANQDKTFYRWIAVAGDGTVQVEFQQRDDTPGNRLLNTYLSTANRGGVSFEPQLLVSSGPTDPNINFSGTFIGDYNGVAASTGAAHPIWTDARRVVCGLVVTDCQKNQDAVTATVTFF